MEASIVRRVWEVDWRPAVDDGAPWAAYPWLLRTAVEIGATEVFVAVASYEVLDRLVSTIGSDQVRKLRRTQRSYRASGVTVRAVSRRGSWWAHGPVLVAWAKDDVLAQVEGMHPPAIAAVAAGPDDIAAWRKVHNPPRIGEVRPDSDAGSETLVVAELDPRVSKAIDGAAISVNRNHWILATDERELIAGALIALRSARVAVDLGAFRAHLMAAGWSGSLIIDVLRLAKRIEAGATPRHRKFPLD